MKSKLNYTYSSKTKLVLPNPIISRTKNGSQQVLNNYVNIINSINNNHVTLTLSNNQGGEKISIPINNLKNKIQRGGYINIKKYGRRKIRYYKNGNPYVIINGKKKKI